MCDPLGVRAIRELAVPPHFRHPGERDGLVKPGDGGWPEGHGARRWPRQPFLPALGSVFAGRTRGRLLSFRRLSAGRPARRAARDSRDPALLVSVSALPPG